MNAELLSRIQQLNQHYQAIGDYDLTLQSRIIIRYCQKVLAELLKITMEKPIAADLITSLKVFFEHNWSVIKSTLLSYTSLPHHDFTHLLCDIAAFVAEETNKVTPSGEKPCCIIDVLMPTICYDSVSDNYPSLGPEQEPNGTWRSPELSIKTILQTHILGRDARYLIPVKLYASIELGIEKNQLQNPYFDYQNHNPDMAYLDASDVERLIAHSAATRALFDARAQYEQLANDKHNLLGHLRQLCSLLYFNSAHGGIGHQENAASGVYQAIIHFNDYYQKLGAEDQVNIPLPVNNEILFLLELAGNPEKNKDATHNIATCIGVRREKLEPLVNVHEASLSEIGLHGENKAILIEQAKATFIACRESLITMFYENNYLSGHDRQPLRLTILNALNMTFSLATVPDLQNLQALSVTEITDVLKSVRLKNELRQLINSVESLVLFSVETPAVKLKTILSIFPDVARRLINSPGDLISALITLDVERFQIMFDTIKSRIHLHLFQAKNYIDLLEEFTPEQRFILFGYLTPFFSTQINTLADVKLMLEYLNKDMRQGFYLVMKEKLPQLFKSTDDYTGMFISLSEELKEEFYAEVKNQWVEHINQTSGGFFKVMSDLHHREKPLLLKALLPNIQDVINNKVQFVAIFSILNPQDQRLFFRSMLPKLASIISTAQDFKEVCMHCAEILNDIDYRTLFYQSIEPQLNHVFKRPEDFLRIQGLSHSIQVDFIAIMQIRMCEIGSTVNNFIHGGQYPNKHVFYETMKEKLPSMIKNVIDLVNVLNSLEVEQFSDLVQRIKPTFFELVSSVDTFFYLFGAICNLKKKRLYFTLFNDADEKNIDSDIDTTFTKLSELNVELPPLLNYPQKFFTNHERQIETLQNALLMQFKLYLCAPTISATELRCVFNALIESLNDTEHAFKNANIYRCKKLIQDISKIDNDSLSKLTKALTLNPDEVKELPSLLKAAYAFFSSLQMNHLDNIPEISQNAEFSV